MQTKKYVFLFILNSFLWFLLYCMTVIISPTIPNPEGIWDTNIAGFFLALAMALGIHLIPFYLLCIKNVKTAITNFFFLNITHILIWNPLIWINIFKIGIPDSSNTTPSILGYLFTSFIHTIIFSICFFIKKLYYKLRG